MTYSAIDALSYRVLHPPQAKTLYLSTDGSGYVPLAQLKLVPKVVTALNQDQAGEATAARLRQDLPQASRHTPTAKDWNEDLQTYFRELQQQIEAQQRTKQQTQEREYGLEL